LEGIVRRLRALWKKTGDIEPVYRVPGSPKKKVEEVVEGALVQL
jgi:hypothetical protein